MRKTVYKNGRIRYEKRYKDPLTLKTRYMGVTIKPSGKWKKDERLAEKIIDDKIRAVIVGSTAPKDVTLGELCRLYTEWKQRNAKPQTARASAARLSTICRLIGEDVIVSKLTAAVVEDRLEKYAGGSYNGLLDHFKTLMRWGYRYDYVSDIAFLGKLTRKKEPSTRAKDADKYLEKDEIPKVLEEMDDKPRWQFLTEFLILSGLRVGEALALEDADVDTEERLIHVTKTYAVATREISSPKTETSYRDVYMQDELLDCCRRIRSFMKRDQLEHGYRSRHFFAHEGTGGYLTYSAYLWYLSHVTERTIGRRLTPHALRHTHTALLAEAGIPLADISERLGHEDSKVTREVYMHVTERMKEQAHERIKHVKLL